MYSKLQSFGIACVAVVCIAGGAAYGAGESALAAKLGLPADFVPQAAEFAENDTNGQYTALAQVRGRALKPRNGLQPLYIVRAEKGRFAGDPLMAGDLVLSVSGRQEPVIWFKRMAERTQVSGGKLSFVRWRKGVTETATIMFDGPVIPDLTKGGEHDPEQEDWSLGPSGAQGWIWAIPHQSTEGAKQIYVTQVEPGSPADGVLAVGDVIIGASGKVFTHDARKEFGNALTEAETPEKEGKLVLTVWNNGKTREATVLLKVMGQYTTTSLDSPKTRQIVEDACAYLTTNGIGSGILGHVNALGLLATGRDDVMPLVRAYVRKLADHGTNLPASNEEMSTWNSGYANLVLTEYYLATKDESVLPAIRAYSTRIATGQSRVGTWGHRLCFPYPFDDGPVYGICPGYGALNQAGLPCMISMALATKCGVTNDEIRLALHRGSSFFKFFVDKGAVPYGDHAPGVSGHDDNGKSSITAVMFDLLGEEDAALFFTKMTVASYQEREGGHTGNYFNFLWGPLAAARGGDAAVAAFMKRLEWFFDIERRRRGNFEYQGKPGMANKKGSEHAYKGWDCTGARLLAYCLPLKKLYITGKGRTIKDITGKELDTVVAAGELTTEQYKNLSADELVARLASWSPAVRRRAAMALEGKPENVVTQLIGMLDSSNRYARYGACDGLHFAGRASEAAVDALVAKGLRSKDPTLRYFAMHAFTSRNAAMGLSTVAARAIPELLKMAATKDPADPHGRTQQELAMVLFYSGSVSPLHAVFRNGAGVEKANNEQLVAAVRSLLKVNNGGSRSCVAVVYDKLSDADLKLLWKDIYRAVREQAPSGVMFSAGVRENGIRLMATHHAREGLELAVWYMRNQKPHGTPNGTKAMLKIIVEEYGGHAKRVIPELEKTAQYFVRVHGEKTGGQMAEEVRAAIKEIKAAATPEWQMTSIARYL